MDETRAENKMVYTFIVKVKEEAQWLSRPSIVLCRTAARILQLRYAL